MKARKPTSKRKSTKLTEGIKKKAAAHQRKQRKQAKTDVTWKSRKPKDPGIPNSFPYKGQILAEMEEAKRIEAEEKLAKRQAQRQAALEAGHSEAQIEEAFAQEEAADNSNRLTALLESATAAANEYEGGDDEDDSDDSMRMNDDDDNDEQVEVLTAEDIGAGASTKDLSRKAYDKIYKKVVELSDVVLYVLDARDPEQTRSKQVEHHILASPEKRLIYVLNKIDLVPPEALKAWRTRLELNFPVVPLAASHAAPNAQTFTHPGLTPVRTATMLLQSLKRYAHSAQKKRSISIGIVGYPNVGKSSVINALTARHGKAGKACPVGALAGVTTSIRKVKIDNKLSMWDSPGIVFPAEKKGVDETSRLVLLNALPPKQIDDPVAPVSLLLNRLSKSEHLLQRLYATYDVPPIVTIPHSKFVTEFLVHVARKMGRLGRGGVPDITSAAQAVITDWRDGRIVGWSMPKKDKEEKKDSTPVIVTQWAEEFKLDGLWDEMEE